MTQATIISCAITGGAPDMHRINPAVPITPKQIANDALAAARAGAAIVHIHVRDPETGTQSVELQHYREVTERIRDSGADVIINLTTGPGAKLVPSRTSVSPGAPGSLLMTPEQRVAHILELRPELCSLDIATLNFGAHLFVNAIGHIEEMARLIEEAGARTEIEVFDTGHLRLASHLLAKERITAPALFQFCLGVPWGAPADASTMLLMQSQLPQGMPWSAFGVSRHQFPIAAHAAATGGHIRVGLEDNLYLRQGILAPGNAALVERAVSIVELIGSEAATAKQAREMLGLGRATAFSTQATHDN